MNLTLGSIRCDSKEDAVTLASHSMEFWPGAWMAAQTFVIMGEIAAAGWVAIPRVVEHLQGGRPGVILRCDREDMATGRAA